jgi:hypothetical protein
VGTYLSTLNDDIIRVCCNMWHADDKERSDKHPLNDNDREYESPFAKELRLKIPVVGGEVGVGRGRRMIRGLVQIPLSRKTRTNYLMPGCD